MKRIYFNCKSSLQNTIQRMNSEIADAVEALGYDVGRFSEKGAGNLSRDFSEGRVSAIVSFNTYFGSSDGFAEVLKAAGVKYFFYGTDHPYHAFSEYHQFVSEFDNITISLTGRDEVALAQKLFPRPDVFRWLPQGSAVHAQVPLQGREFDHLLVGNNPLATSKMPPTPEAFRSSWPAGFGVQRARQLNAMVEVFTAFPLKPLADIVDEVANRQFPQATLEERRFYAKILDIYLRAQIRADAIRALLPHQAVICGLGWDFLADSSARAVFRGSLDNDAVQDLARRAGNVYNAVPPYYSCSERVLEAMSMGTPVATTPSRFFQEEFGDTLRYFVTGRDLSELLATPESDEVRHDRVARARALFLAGHSWDARVRKILAWLEEPPRDTH